MWSSYQLHDNLFCLFILCTKYSIKLYFFLQVQEIKLSKYFPPSCVKKGGFFLDKLQLEYLNPSTARQYDFYLIPKLLIDHEAFDGIDYGAKLLYSLMLNRASLSATNAKDFTDKNGNLYIIYTVEQVMVNMRCAKATAVKMLKQLDEIGLIEKKRQGQGKPTIIYVKDFATVDFLKFKSYTSRSSNNETQEVQNLKCSYNDLISVVVAVEEPPNESPKSELNNVSDQKESSITVRQQRIIEKIKLVAGGFTVSAGFASEICNKYEQDKIDMAIDELGSQLNQGLKIKKSIGAWLRSFLDREYSSEQAPPPKVTNKTKPQRKKQKISNKNKEFIKTLYV